MHCGAALFGLAAVRFCLHRMLTALVVRSQSASWRNNESFVVYPLGLGLPAIDRHSHSTSDTLFGLFPYIISCLTLMNWIASRTSGTRK
jgi:hypothetical protein